MTNTVAFVALVLVFIAAPVGPCPRDCTKVPEMCDCGTPAECPGICLGCQDSLCIVPVFSTSLAANGFGISPSWMLKACITRERLAFTLAVEAQREVGLLTAVTRCAHLSRFRL